MAVVIRDCVAIWRIPSALSQFNDHVAHGDGVQNAEWKVVLKLPITVEAYRQEVMYRRFAGTRGS